MPSLSYSKRAGATAQGNGLPSMWRPSMCRLRVPRTTADQVYNCCRSRWYQDSLVNNTKSKSTEKGCLGTSSDSLDSLDMWKVSSGDCLGIKLGSTWAESALSWGRGVTWQAARHSHRWRWPCSSRRTTTASQCTETGGS